MDINIYIYIHTCDYKLDCISDKLTNTHDTCICIYVHTYIHIHIEQAIERVNGQTIGTGNRTVYVGPVIKQDHDTMIILTLVMLIMLVLSLVVVVVVVSLLLMLLLLL